MEGIIKQNRVSFLGTGRGSRAPKPLSFNEDYNWLNEYDLGDERFTTSVAAAAYAIHSLDLANSGFRNGKTLTKERSWKGGQSVLLPWRRATDIEPASTGTKTKPTATNSSLTRKPSKVYASSSLKSAFSKESTDDKIENWERSEIEKIKKRYAQIRAKIQSWEEDKKTKAKIQLQKKKIELECNKERNQRHYQLNFERIRGIGKSARAQMEEKMRREETQLKERAKNMRLRRKAPYFICF